MSIKQHCTLMFSSHVVILCGGGATVYFVHHAWDRTGFLLAIGFVGLLIANQWLFHLVIPARCSKCGERVKLETMGTYQYRCPACAHVHDTGISSEPVDIE
jgi:hypothetical protein